jgi:large subunit ribosomal protein L29
MIFKKHKPNFQIFKSSNFQIATMANKQTYEFNKSIKDLNLADLKTKIQEDELRMKKLEFAHAISPLENPMTIRGLRRDIARLKTELKKKELGL